MTPDKRLHTPTAVPPVEEETSDDRLLRVRERPDGYHWIDVEGRQEFGPFETLEEALADMEGVSGPAIEQTELTEAAEQGVEIEAQIDRRDEDEPEGST